MGKFIDELKKRGAYQYGSRALGVATDKSDYDWALLYTTENEQFLYRHGFAPDIKKTANPCVRNNYYSTTSRAKTARPVTDFPRMENETLLSFRKGSTNVVLLTPMLFGATKYATDMTNAHKTEFKKNKDNRIMMYQTYSTEYAEIMRG